MKIFIDLLMLDLLHTTRLGDYLNQQISSNLFVFKNSIDIARIESTQNKVEIWDFDMIPLEHFIYFEQVIWPRIFDFVQSKLDGAECVLIEVPYNELSPDNINYDFYKSKFFDDLYQWLIYQRLGNLVYYNNNDLQYAIAIECKKNDK